MGGRVADVLREAGVTTAAQLRALRQPRLVEEMHIKAPVAAQLLQWARGEDSREVVDKGPPKSLQVRRRRALRHHGPPLPCEEGGRQ